MSKRGTSTDAIVMIVMMFCICIGLLIVGAMFTPLKAGLSATMGTAGNASLASTENALGTRDTYFVLVWFGAAFISLVSAFMVKTHPAYIGLALLFFIPMLLLGPLFSNTYEYVTNTSIFAAGVTEMPQTSFFMDNLFIFNLGFSVLLLIVLYVNFRSGD